MVDYPILKQVMIEAKKELLFSKGGNILRICADIEYSGTEYSYGKSAAVIDIPGLGIIPKKTLQLKGALISYR